MGFLSGSLGIKRYFIEDMTPVASDPDRTLTQLGEYVFMSIEDAPVEEAIGWVPPLRVFDRTFKHEDVFMDRNLFLAMRVDRKSVSRVLVDAKINELLHKGEASPKGRQELKQLKEDLTHELLAKTLPSPRIVEGVVDLDRNTLYLNTASHRSSKLFINLFEKTFGVLPVHMDPTAFAYVALQNNESLTRLSETVESCFHDI